MALHAIFIFVAAMSVTTSAQGQANMIENESFELMKPDRGSRNSYSCEVPRRRTNCGMYTVKAPSDCIKGWFIARGDINWGRGWWHASPDGSPSAVDLNGYTPGVITTTLRLVPDVNIYTVVLDAGSHSSIGSAKIMAAFDMSVHVSSHCLSSPSSSKTTSFNSSSAVSASACASFSTVVINSTHILINMTKGHDRDNRSVVNWDTRFFSFNTSSISVDRAPCCDRVNLTLSSMTLGKYGPIVDHVRVYPGIVLPSRSKNIKSARKYKLMISMIVLLVSMSAICIAIYLRFRRIRKQSKGIDDKLHERVRMFSYSALKTSTRNFHAENKLGQGGFGQVFKGVLHDGSVVAIKQLKSTNCEGKLEFINEISTISCAQHKNLVVLKGFAIKGNKGFAVKGNERLLVYQFMPQGSLDKALFNRGSRAPLDWSSRLKIVMGTARGIAYMHHDSKPRIIHRDIKASNILLDESYNAKVADFGLAKFFKDDQSLINTCTVAGTIGYLAPEYALRGQLTEKADVFSFGVVVLEIVSGRTNMDIKLPLLEQYVVDWAWHLHNEGRISEFVDPALEEEYDVEEAARMIEIGLACTCSDPQERPSMTNVLSMLCAESQFPTVSSSASSFQE